MPRHFGQIEGNPPGTTYENRAAVAAANVHKPLVAGISGGASEGADSIVLSGGYEDDQDLGDEIIYTGHGGNDPNTGRQIADQELHKGNMALALSRDLGLPVRVVRGSNHRGPYSPAAGYRYDGLYYVASAWHETPAHGFRIWRFRLVRQVGQPAIVEGDAGAQLPLAPAPRVPTTILRVVRSTAMARRVKGLHDSTCQVCRTQLETSTGPYAEGAHIQAIGAPENGPDVIENLLCLCPSCHVQFDRGGLAIAEDLRILDASGHPTGKFLRTVRGHTVAREYLAYRAAHSRLADCPPSADL